MNALKTRLSALGNVQKLYALAIKTAKSQVDAIESLTASDEFLENIAISLRTKPKSWLVPTPDSDWYDRIKEDIGFALTLPDEDVLFVVNAAHRWVLIKTEDRVLPYVFLDRGGVAQLIRMVVSTGVSYLPALDELISTLVLTGGYSGEAVIRERRVDLPEPSKQIDNRFSVSGVFFDV